MTDANKTHAYKRIMVIDDNQIDRYIAEKTIKKFHFSEEVVPLESAVDALEQLSALSDKMEELPEIILLDINMPEMNGFEFLEKYAELPDTVKKKCIIVMLTTSLNEDDRMVAEKNPYIHQFLNKPLNEETLKKIRLVK
ncbi:MAG: response regulator [Taibaiella sp.]|nr:response regulator [Taibaiella sp.]